MAELVESSEKSSAAELAANKAKLQALERQLGISTSSASSSSNPSAAGSSKPTNEETDAELVRIAQKRKKFDDNAFFETSREINDGVRSAVAAGEWHVPLSDLGSDLSKSLSSSHLVNPILITLGL